jgi:hypothetical protein
VPEIDRRVVLRLGVLGLTLAGSAVGTARFAAGAPDTTHLSQIVEEIYRNRHILIYLPIPGIGPAGRARVYIDDRELHVMPLRDGTYTSVMNHYRRFRTLLETARAACNNLRGAALVPHS